MATRDLVKGRINVRERRARKVEKETRREQAIEAAKPRWKELTRLEQQVNAKIAEIVGEQSEVINELREEGMTAIEIAAELDTEVGVVRRRMLQSVKGHETKTQPLTSSKS